MHLTFSLMLLILTILYCHNGYQSSFKTACLILKRICQHNKHIHLHCQNMKFKTLTLLCRRVGWFSSKSNIQLCNYIFIIFIKTNQLLNINNYYQILVLLAVFTHRHLLSFGIIHTLHVCSIEH